MTLRFANTTALAATLCAALFAAAPAAAQTADVGDWTGPYAGVRLGYAFLPKNDDETVLFDTNLDGTFGDTVRTGAGADAFSTGFCGGGAGGATVASGCGDDKDGYDVSAHLGFDYQIGNFVVGVVGEYGRANIRDDVTAFSTTPASYTLTRRLRDNGNVRARAGVAIGQTLIYGTGGFSYGKIRNTFRTTNAANQFVNSGNDEAYGYNAGGGFDIKVARNFSIGAMYLFRSLEDDDFRVRTFRGTAPATNPFVIVNTAGTNFARSEGDFESHSVTAVASFRF